MLADKKKALSIIIAGLGGKMKGKPEGEMESEDEGEDEESMDEGLKAAAEDIITAISTKNSDMLAKALRDFVGMC